MSKYKLIISDLDGTLLNPNGKISDETMAVINEIKDKGIKFAILSGRQYKFISPIIKEHKLECYAIGLNGGEIVDHSENSTCEDIIEYDDLKEIVSILDKENVIYQVYNENGVITKEIDNMIEELLDFGRLHCSDVRGIIDGALIYYDVIFKDSIITKDILSTIERENFHVVKLVALSPDRNKLDKIAERLKQYNTLAVTTSHMSNIEVSHKNVNKGEAVKKIAKLLDISTKEIIGIGDHLNDLPMLEQVGLSIAMGNAIPELKEKVDYVTDTNDKDGVAKAIRKFVL